MTSYREFKQRRKTYRQWVSERKPQPSGCTGLVTFYREAYQAQLRLAEEQLCPILMTTTTTTYYHR